jgi:hypothetical protein
MASLSKRSAPVVYWGVPADLPVERPTTFGLVIKH